MFYVCIIMFMIICYANTQSKTFKLIEIKMKRKAKWMWIFATYLILSIFSNQDKWKK
jgi:hypothetical protein